MKFNRLTPTGNIFISEIKTAGRQTCFFALDQSINLSGVTQPLFIYSWYK